MYNFCGDSNREVLSQLYVILEAVVSGVVLIYSILYGAGVPVMLTPRTVYD